MEEDKMPKRDDDLKQIILRNYVKNIVCIDDDFQGAYSQTYLNNTERQLYLSLCENTQSFVTMQRFDANMDKCISLAVNSDMIILDWELDENATGARFQQTLQILERVLESNTSLICIYTQTDNIIQVYDQVHLFFGGKPEEDLIELNKKITLESIEVETFEGAIIKMLGEGEITEDNIISDIASQRRNNNLGKNILSDQDILEYLKCRTMREQSQAILPERGAKHYNIVRLHKDRQVTGLNIDGKLLTVFHKMENRQGIRLNNPIPPSDLFDRIAETIILAPNSFFSIVWFEKLLEKTVFFWILYLIKC